MHCDRRNVIDPSHRASDDFAAAFAAAPIIGILRGIAKDAVLPVADAAFDGGLRCIEITLNTTGALELIAALAGVKRPGAVIGAGTVLTEKSCGEAIDAGARFIVAPNSNPAVISLCKKSGIPVLPGALTPSEVYRAWESGATMVKVFPVSLAGGPAYIKELRGPFDAIPLLACGGVTLRNISDYFRAGATGIAVGGKVFKGEWIAAGNFSGIGELISEFVGAVKVKKTSGISTSR